MTIFVGDADQWDHRSLYLAIVERLKELGCAGATVTRGVAGFGAHSEIHTANILRLSVDLPVIITAVDAPEKIDAALPEISTMVGAGLITVEETEIYFHSAAFRGGLPDIQVGSIMSARPEAVGPDTPITEVIARLLARDYTALPVVDNERRVIGMISDGDMLSAGITGLSVSLHKAAGPERVREFLKQEISGVHTVRRVMTTPVTVTERMPLKEAAHLMHVRQLKRLPVVDDEGRLVGVLGRLDVLQSVATGYARRTTPQALRLPQEHRTVGEIMEREVPTVPETAPLADVVGKLLDSDAKRLVVLDEAGRPSGMITDTDIVARLDPEDRPGVLTALRGRWSSAAHRQLQRAYGERAEDVMTTPLITVADSASVIDALTLAVARHVKRLPVIDSAGKIVGVVSRPALLAASLDLAAGGKEA